VTKLRSRMERLTRWGPVGAATRPMRLRPTFFIIGAKKAGTTSLTNYLGAHPDVDLPYRKVLHHFDSWTSYERGLGAYLTSFPLRRPGGPTCTGESTPYYLFHPHTPARVHAAFPDARYVVLLRDPVDRAVSDYWHQRRAGVEALPLETAMRDEDERVAAELERMHEDETYDSTTVRYFAYLTRGRYAEQLERWFAQVPRERILVLTSRELSADPAATCNRMLDFLGLAPLQLPSYPRSNAGSYPATDPRLVDELRERMRPHDDRLSALLGWVPDWRAGRG
jgi:hypothetical protein